MKKLLMVGSLLVIAGGAFADDAVQDAEKQRWHDVAELSLINTTGNTRNLTVGAKNKLSYDGDNFGAEVEGGGYGNQSNGTTTAENYFARQKFTWKLSERWGLFERAVWEKDRFAGLRNRYSIGGGVSFQALNDAFNKLLFELGSGFTAEERRRQRDKQFADGRAYGKYTRQLLENSSFEQIAEIVWAYGDAENYRTYTETALIAKIMPFLAMKAAYIWKYQNDNPPGTGKNDTITALSLLFTY